MSIVPKDAKKTQKTMNIGIKIGIFLFDEKCLKR